MFCPRCKAEYRQGFYTCLNCGVDLVEKLVPEVVEPPPQEFLPLLTLADRNEYDILRLHLEAAGIEYIPGLQLVEKLTFPLKLGVRAEQLETAQFLLDDLDLRSGGLAPHTDEALPAIGLGAMGPSETNLITAVVKEGRFLIMLEEDGSVGLPGHTVSAWNEPGTLEKTLRKMLSDSFGLQVDETMPYLSGWLGRNQAGQASINLLFLARWQNGEPDARAKWLFASEIAALPGVSPGIRAEVDKADRLRIERGW